MLEPLAYRVSDMPFGKSKTYDLIKAGRLETRKVDGVTLITARSFRALLDLGDQREAPTPDYRRADPSRSASNPCATAEGGQTQAANHVTPFPTPKIEDASDAKANDPAR